MACLASWGEGGGGNEDKKKAAALSWMSLRRSDGQSCVFQDIDCAFHICLRRTNVFDNEKSCAL